MASLLNFNLRLIPSTIWMVLGVYSLNFFIADGILVGLIGTRELNGIADSVGALPIMMCIILAIQLVFATGVGWSGGPFVWLIPAGEFLLVRPIPRRTAYFSRAFLYFMIILMVPLVKVGMTMPEADLRLSLYHSKTQSTEAAHKLALYQDQFPGSSVVRLPGAYHDTLVIPWGATLIALWQLWLVILFALALQVTTLLSLPQNIQIGTIVGICFVPLLTMAFSPFRDELALMEGCFFVFVHNWAFIVIATMGAFVLVQRIAQKRIQDLEII
jgi:hypothetical protein